MEEEKVLNYPVKYAIMEVFEQSGWNYGLNELERNYEVVANIVLKCYVIGERRKYHKDGSSSVKYEIVFLYNRSSLDNYLLFKINYPEYNIFTNECINATFVDTLYNTFEEAKEVASKANEEVLNKKLLYLTFGPNFKEKLAKLEDEYKDILAKYQRIEDDIEAKTKDVKITSLESDEIVSKRILSK